MPKPLISLPLTIRRGALLSFSLRLCYTLRPPPSPPAPPPAPPAPPSPPPPPGPAKSCAATQSCPPEVVEEVLEERNATWLWEECVNGSVVNVSQMVFSNDVGDLNVPAALAAHALPVEAGARGV